ncbi:restriction endonuclease subunit R [Candidatus Brocadia sapporoensis]|uniref:site-specific DNA-methyltransferase (adenine-specific) n=1 Tax=Candidatus Brocadia sapporoensis TaxID=392547 RepID=A0A1V6LYM8_9BACT|nr:N-6 DNA methylase [Candidatus Brocadia sapporoensis]OQD45268.1 restriction endonuclease subunit R [Candidatus Brocadia sapporoensis]GJQ23289.1 MAG: adenine methyltransferase [Candidatus Brocadia sapporoensis]
MTVPQEILGLIERFDNNREAYRSGTYNETQLRREFIDPFFKILGWDVDNEKGYAEAYKDVIHEDSIKVGGMTKAPDYCFRIGGVRKFFVEAKKPAVNLKDDVDSAFQLRRYAWSAKLPLSILTDFEEFVVYDCRVKPDKLDKPSTARILYLNYTSYAQRWDEIASIFSRDAVLKGAFDKYAETSKAKRGTAEVDTAFLKEIESWRDMLARNLALRNPDMTQHDLNFAIQRTIDRIIFLRICEDRGIEKYGRLMALQNGDRVYARLCEIFHRADERYNSGLFHFQKEKGRSESPDTLTLSLAIDDGVLKDIIKNLYYPDSPYEFSVLSADILGQVYEQFLGKVIRLTAGHRAVVEDKPEVKKAGGVYYTPTYIVDYIVKNTVGKLLECEIQSGERAKIPLSKGGKGVVNSEIQNLASTQIRDPKSKIRNVTPKAVAKVRILDPACGSGSFLLGAYKYLLDWHRDWYVADGPEKWSTGRSPTLYQGMGGDWRLITAERKRILLNNIYGVDIDPQAVEVTKLSLLLKVLEGESEQTIVKQLKLFHERALPDLGNNIKCGNSLIGTDFYNPLNPPLLRGNQDIPLRKGGEGVVTHLAGSGVLSDEERYRINPFDWAKEFPEIMKNGGFDVVIGNPPYVRQEGLGDLKEYLQRKYTVYHGMADLYAYFIEKGVSLLRDKGIFGYIVSNKWMRANYGEPLRKWLMQQCIEQIVDFGDLPVFQRATTYPCILVIGKGKPSSTFVAAQVKTLEFESLEGYVKENRHSVKLSILDDTGWSLADERSAALLNKLKKSGIPLKEYVKGKIYRGVLTGLNEAFVIDEETRNRLVSEDPKSKEIIKPFLIGRDVKRYQPPTSKQFLIFTRRGIEIQKYPPIEKYLSRYKEQLMPKPKDWKGSNWKGRKPGSYKWYEIQDAVDYYAEFEKPKIIIPTIVQSASYTIDNLGFYSNDKTSVIATDDLYLLGILNSRVTDFVMHSISSTKQGGYFEYKPMYFSQVPIRTIDSSNPSDKSYHDSTVALVRQMLELHKQLASAKTDHDKTVIQRQIDATDRQIDQLVYELYGLTEDEIKIVEESSA